MHLLQPAIDRLRNESLEFNQTLLGQLLMVSGNLYSCVVLVTTVE